MTPSNQKPGRRSEIDDVPEDRGNSAGSPTPEDKSEAMEGAEQREEGGYQ